jgi:hypothetical protein
MTQDLKDEQELGLKQVPMTARRVNLNGRPSVVTMAENRS